MKLFLNGGGMRQPETAQYYQPRMAEIYSAISGATDNSKPVLYIPWAKPNDKYPERRDWIAAEMAGIKHGGIETVLSGAEFIAKNLNDYSYIHIGGGNTYKLLKELKNSGSFAKIREYLQNGGTVYGCSAGAEIFGKDIALDAFYGSENHGLSDTGGMNMLGGVSVFGYYLNGTPDFIERVKKHLVEYSVGNEPIIAMGEEDLLCINESGEISTVCGSKYYIFKNGARIQGRQNMPLSEIACDL